MINDKPLTYSENGEVIDNGELRFALALGWIRGRYKKTSKVPMVTMVKNLDLILGRSFKIVSLTENRYFRRILSFLI
jgi:hypothetical protein